MSVMSGLELMAAIAAAVAMKPSMTTRRLDVAACRIAAAIIAISKPPYSVKAVAASSWDGCVRRIWLGRRVCVGRLRS